VTLSSRAAASAALLVALATLTGCALAPQPVVATSSAEPVSPVTGVWQAFPVDAEIGEVVATATIEGIDPIAADLDGHSVEISRGEDAGGLARTWLVSFPDLDLPEGALWDVRVVGVLPEQTPATDSETATEGPLCAASDFAFGLPTLGIPGNEASDFLFGIDDPTWLAGLVFAPVPSAGSTTEPLDPACLLPITAVARLEWTVEPALPELEAVDSGPGDGASGDAARDEGGALVQYVTAPGDSYSQIAERFGLTPLELDYLNPASDWSSFRDYLEVNCSLNLALETRGAPDFCVTP